MSGKPQRAEIAKALSRNLRLLILDKPTASLNETDSAKLPVLLLAFKRHGVTSVLIIHKPIEIRMLSDTIKVIRDGAAVSRLDCHAGISEGDIIRKPHPATGRGQIELALSTKSLA